MVQYWREYSTVSATKESSCSLFFLMAKTHEGRYLVDELSVWAESYGILVLRISSPKSHVALKVKVNIGTHFIGAQKLMSSDETADFS